MDGLGIILETKHGEQIYERSHYLTDMFLVKLIRVWNCFLLQIPGISSVLFSFSEGSLAPAPTETRSVLRV